MCVCGMLHPVLDHGPQRCQTGSQGERPVQGVGRPTQGWGAHTQAHVRAQGLCTAPRGGQGLRAPLRCIPGVIMLRRRPLRGAAGIPATQRGSCVPAWNVPGGSAASQSFASQPRLILATNMWRDSPPGWHSAGAWCCRKPGSVFRFCLEDLLSSVPCHLAQGLVLARTSERKPHLPILDL